MRANSEHPHTLKQQMPEATMLTAAIAREECIKSWVLERFQARTESEVTALLKTVEPSQALIVQDAIRSTVEKQSIEVGAHRYIVTFFAVPVVVSSSGALSRDSLNLEPIVPALGRAIRECGLAGVPQGGATILSRLVPHAKMRSLDFAEMYGATREIFYSSLVQGSRRIATLRTGNENPFIESPVGEVFVGHLLGCVYHKEGAKRSSVANRPLFTARLQTLLAAHFASLEDTTSVRVGETLPLYKGIERCAALQTEVLVQKAILAVEHEQVVAHMSLSASEQNPTETDLQFDLLATGTTLPLMRLSMTFCQNEAMGLTQAIEFCQEQMVRLAPASSPKPAVGAHLH